MSLTQAFTKTLSEAIASPNQKLNTYIDKYIVPILKNISGVEHYEEYSKNILNGLSAAKEDDLNEIFKRLGFGTRIFSNLDLNFDKNKKYMIVSNHPTGPIEGLFIQKVFHNLGIRGKLIGDDIMSGVEQMKDCYLGLSIRVDGKSRIGQLRNIKKEVSSGTNLAIFPAGSVSKFSFEERKVIEFPWNIGFIELAKSNNLDIIPIYINASLSPLHYLLKSNSKIENLSSLRLFRESFLFVNRNKNKKIDIYIGNPIDIQSLEVDDISAKKIQNICENLMFQSYNFIK